VITLPERDDCTDCCFPQVAYINSQDKLKICALKHLPWYYQRISPLYRLERYKGKLEGKHEVLQTIIDILTNT